MESYVRVITDAAAEPITIDEAKAQSRIDATEEDSYVTSLITVARHAIESKINRPIGEQTLELGLSEWPGICGYTEYDDWTDWSTAFRIEFPRPPLIGINTIKYTKMDGTVVTWYDSTASPVIDPAAFTIETGIEPGTVYLKSDKSWPIDILQYGLPIKIQYRAGLTSIRKDLKQAMLLTIAHLYENREPILAERGAAAVELPYAVEWLLQGSDQGDFR